jgi:hypothetical protein
VLQQIVLLEQVTSLEFGLDGSERFFGILARIDLIIVASLQISSEDAFGIESFVSGQNLKRNIEIFHFVVTQRDVDVDRFVFSALQQQFLIDLGRLLIVAPQVVDGRQSQLVLSTLVEFLVVLHQVFLIVFFMRQMEKKSGLQGSLRPLQSFPPGVIVETQGVIAASLVDMIVLVIRLAQKLIVDANGFPK